MERIILETLKKKPIVVYGSGSSFHWFFEILYLKFRITPVLVVDQRLPRKSEFMGFSSSNTIDDLNPTIKKSDVVILVCIGSDKAFLDIMKLINAQGFTNVFPLHSLYEVHAPFGGDFFKNEDRDALLKRANRIFSHLGDSESKLIFEKVFMTHSTRIPEQVPMTDPRSQWFPDDLPFQLDYTRYLCAGVDDDHDRLSRISSVFPDSCIFVEADHSKLDEFAFTVRSHPPLAKATFLLPLALSDSVGLKPFFSANDSKSLAARGHHTSFGSRIDDNGQDFVQTVTLNELFMSGSPTLVSMDIEGSEMAAITGAGSLLVKFAPDLAISLYHYPEHIIDIPEFILNLDVPYRIYIRNYTGFVAETVLYASIR